MIAPCDLEDLCLHELPPSTMPSIIFYARFFDCLRAGRIPSDVIAFVVGDAACTIALRMVAQDFLIRIGATRAFAAQSKGLQT